MFKRCFIVSKVIVELNDTSVINYENIITSFQKDLCFHTSMNKMEEQNYYTHRIQSIVTVLLMVLFLA